MPQGTVLGSPDLVIPLSPAGFSGKLLIHLNNGIETVHLIRRQAGRTIVPTTRYGAGKRMIAS
jgi:hypothetical protein